MFTGFGNTIFERSINNPRWGLDNWIYVAGGNKGETITGPHLKKGTGAISRNGPKGAAQKLHLSPFSVEFGASGLRHMVSFIFMILVLVFRPGGLFSGKELIHARGD